MAQPVTPRATFARDGTRLPLPLQYYQEKRSQLGPFSEKTRMRQQRKQWHPKHRNKLQLTEDLLLVNGNWNRPTGHSGFGRQAGTFPRVEIHNLLERSLTHRAAHKLGLNAFLVCTIDEYRTSKQLDKLWALLDTEGTRRNKTTPKPSDTTPAWTTNQYGEAVPFYVHQKKHKMQQHIGRDGVKRVTNRDDPTVKNYMAVVEFDLVDPGSRPVTLSRGTEGPQAAQPSARSRKAKDVVSIRGC
jgi:hypothetical protein